jgi:ketosteroid isomerase-like protein
MTDKPTAVELARRSVETFVSKDIKGWVALADENILTEFPFAPEGSPRRLEGRDALYEYIKNYPSNTAIVEWSVSGEVLPNGNSYNMKYATFITFRDGLMTNYREYWDPMTFLKDMGDARF